MIVDITKINQNISDCIFIDCDARLDGDLYKTSGILGTKNLHVDGTIRLNESNDFELNLNLTGIIEIEDSISLEKIDYPISIKIDEIFEKNNTNLTNYLDISDVLWQNIVLEVPLRFTNVDDYSKFEGEGWKLLSEEDTRKSNNPFEDLKNMFGEE